MAVAVTVLVLPLVDIPGPDEGESVWTVVGDHASEVWTFLFTFYVVAIMWLAHNRILNAIGAVRRAHLLGEHDVAGRDRPAALGQRHVRGVRRGDAPASGSCTGGRWRSISPAGSPAGHAPAAAPRTPRGAGGDAVAADSRRAALRGPVLGLYFLLIGVVSVFAPALAAWLPLGIIPLSIWLRPAASTGHRRVMTATRGSTHADSRTRHRRQPGHRPGDGAAPARRRVHRRRRVPVRRGPRRARRRAAGRQLARSPSTPRSTRSRSSSGRWPCWWRTPGITRDTLLMRMTDEDIDDVLQTNLAGASGWPAGR